MPLNESRLNAQVVLLLGLNFTQKTRFSIEEKVKLVRMTEKVLGQTETEDSTGYLEVLHKAVDQPAATVWLPDGSVWTRATAPNQAEEQALHDAHIRIASIDA